MSPAEPHLPCNKGHCLAVAVVNEVQGALISTFTHLLLAPRMTRTDRRTDMLLGWFITLYTNSALWSAQEQLPLPHNTGQGSRRKPVLVSSVPYLDIRILYVQVSLVSQSVETHTRIAAGCKTRKSCNQKHSSFGSTTFTLALYHIRTYVHTAHIRTYIRTHIVCIVHIV